MTDNTNNTDKTKIEHTWQKPTKEERERRLDVVEELICKGLRSSQIQLYFETKEKISLCRATIGRYIQEVTEKWKQEKKPDREEQIKWVAKAYMQCIAECYKIGDIKGALKGLRYYALLFGLEAPTNVNISATTQIKGFSLATAKASFGKIKKDFAAEAKKVIGVLERAKGRTT